MAQQQHQQQEEEAEQPSAGQTARQTRAQHRAASQEEPEVLAFIPSRAPCSKPRKFL